MYDIKLTRRHWLAASTALGIAGAHSFFSAASAQAQPEPGERALDIGSRRELFIDIC